MKGKVKKNDVDLSLVEMALVKKALGFDCTEVVEEFTGGDEGQIKLSKKKVTTKFVPPDMTALKMLIDEKKLKVEQMTDQELENERLRLIQVLKDIKVEGEKKNEK